MKNLIFALFILFMSIFPAIAEEHKMISIPPASPNAKSNGMPQIPGVSGPSFNIADGKFLISITLLLVEIQQGGGMVIPKTKMSRFDVGPEMTGGTLIQLTLDPADIKGVAVAKDPNTLPDGRAFPNIRDGVLPSLRVDTKLLNTSYYFASKVFGIYLPLDFDTRGFSGSSKFNINGKETGMIIVVPSDASGRKAGLLLVIYKNAMESLEKTLELSKKNPGIVY